MFVIINVSSNLFSSETNSSTKHALLLPITNGSSDLFSYSFSSTSNISLQSYSFFTFLGFSKGSSTTTHQMGPSQNYYSLFIILGFSTRNSVPFINFELHEVLLLLHLIFSLAEDGKDIWPFKY